MNFTVICIKNKILNFNSGRLMNVTFRTAFGEEIYLTLDPSDTITAVKESLSERTGADINKILLFYQSYLLRDDLTINELNLAEDSFIGMRVHNRPAIKDINEDDPNVVNLMSFGFSRQASLTALKSSSNNFNQALELLLNDAGNGENDNHNNNGSNNSHAGGNIGLDETQRRRSDKVETNNNQSVPQNDGDDPIERLVRFSGFERYIVTQVYDNFRQNEEEARAYLEQMISG